MKKLVLIFILSFFIQNFSIAQKVNNFYFGLGYGASFAPLSGFNDVMRHYQSTRNAINPSLSDEGEALQNSISDLNVLIGPNFGFGYMFKPSFNFEFRYIARRNNRDSYVESSTGATIHRRIDFSSQSFGFGASKLFSSGKSDYIIGATFNWTQVKVNTSNSLSFEPVNQYHVGPTVFMKYIFSFSETSPFAIVINPYIQTHLNDIDYSDLNKSLNPNTAGRLDSDKTTGSRWYYGLEIQLNYFVFTGFNKEE